MRKIQDYFLFRLNSRNIGILLLSFLLSSCGSSKKAGTSSHTSSFEKSSPEKDRFDEAFFQGQAEKMKGEHDKAIEYFKEALRIDKNNAAANYELAGIYFNQTKYVEAEPYAQRSVYINPTNKWYRLLLGDIYRVQSKWPQAVETYEAMITNYPDERDYYKKIADIFLYQHKLNESIKMYDRMEKHFGDEEEIHLDKYKAYYTAGKYEKAADELSIVLKKDPENKGNILPLMVQCYLKAGKEDKAYDILKQLENASPDDPSVNMQLADYYTRTGQMGKYMSSLKKAFRSPEINIDNKVEIVYRRYILPQQVDTGNLLEAAVLCEAIVTAHPNDAKSHALYADVLNLLNKNVPAREEYRKSIAIVNNKYLVWSQLLRIDAILKDNKTLVEDCKKAIELFPNQLEVYYFYGIGLNELKQYKEAAEIISSGLSLVSDDEPNKNLVMELYMNRAEAFYRLKDYERSDNDFEKILKINPDNSAALNNYAYYLSVRNEKLEKAAEMSKQSLVIDPKSATYQDTYGWILFRQGKYTEAEEYIKKAVMGDPGPEVMEHCGDVLFRLNRIEEAVSYWEKARKLGADSPELLRKIQQKRILE